MNVQAIVNPGELTEKVTIQENNPATSETGERTPVWTDWRMAFAKVSPQRARDKIRAERLTTEQRFIVKMWYVNGLDETMRIVHGDTILNIVSIVNVESQNIAHELVCVKDGS